MSDCRKIERCIGAVKEAIHDHVAANGDAEFRGLVWQNAHLVIPDVQMFALGERLRLEWDLKAIRMDDNPRLKLIRFCFRLQYIDYPESDNDKWSNPNGKIECYPEF